MRCTFVDIVKGSQFHIQHYLCVSSVVIISDNGWLLMETLPLTAVDVDHLLSSASFLVGFEARSPSIHKKLAAQPSSLLFLLLFALSIPCGCTNLARRIFDSRSSRIQPCISSFTDLDLGSSLVRLISVLTSLYLVSFVRKSHVSTTMSFFQGRMVVKIDSDSPNQ